MSRISSGIPPLGSGGARHDPIPNFMREGFVMVGSDTVPIFELKKKEWTYETQTGGAIATKKILVKPYIGKTVDDNRIYQVSMVSGGNAHGMVIVEPTKEGPRVLEVFSYEHPPRYFQSGQFRGMLDAEVATPIAEAKEKSVTLVYDLSEETRKLFSEAVLAYENQFLRSEGGAETTEESPQIHKFRRRRRGGGGEAAAA